MASADAFIGWLRRNLAFNMAVISVTSAALGGVVTGTVRVVDYNNQMRTEEHERLLLTKRVEDIEKRRDEDRKETDSRRGQLASDLADIRRRLAVAEETPGTVGSLASRVSAIDERLGGIGGRTALLEGQVGFIADFVKSEMKGTRK